MNQIIRIIIVICLIISGIIGVISPIFAVPSFTPGDGLMVYGVTGNTNPQLRAFSYSTGLFGTAGNTVAGAVPLVTVLRTSTTKQEAIFGYVDSGGTLRVVCYDGTTFSNEWSASVGGTGVDQRFDIGYEMNTGDVMVLYGTNTATTNELAYRTKLGSTGCGASNWSAATNLDPVRTSGVIQWVKIATDRRSTSNLMTAIWADANSDLSSQVWSGTAWGNEPAAALSTNLERVAAAQDVDSFDLAYESLSGDLMIVWGLQTTTNGVNGVRYATCTGGVSACTWSVVTTPATLADDATYVSVAAHPTSDEIVLATIGNQQNDLQVGYWSGSAWTNTANLDTTVEATLARAKRVATGWLVSGATSRSVVAYNDTNATNIGWYVGNAGVFTVQTDAVPGTTFTDPQGRYAIDTDPVHRDRLLFSLSDSPTDVFAKQLVMTSTPVFTWSDAEGVGGAPLSTTLTQLNPQAFWFAYWQAREFSIDIVNSSGASVASPTVTMSSATTQFSVGTTTGTLGTASEKIRVVNWTHNPQWSLTIAPSGGATALWTGGLNTFDFNDPTAGAGDGGDADTVGGQMTINPSVSTHTAASYCNTTGVTKGSSASYSQGVTDSITLATGGATASTFCYWDVTGVGVSQSIPTLQASNSYSLPMTLTLIAI